MTHRRPTTPTVARPGTSGTPTWYWWALAAGWIVIGVVIDLGRPWITAIATILFGAMHAAIYPYAVGWSRPSPGRPSLGVAVIGSLLVLAGLTAVITILLTADGADHPATAAGIYVATLVLLGGPALMSWLRNSAPAHR